MQLLEHGGGCCGVRHIRGFQRSPANRGYASYGPPLPGGGSYIGGFTPNNLALGPELLDALLAEFYRRYQEEEGGSSRLIEAILTDAQEAAGWRAEIERRGFVRTIRFLNRNTGNFCNIYYLYRHREGNNFAVFNGQPVAAPVIPVARQEIVAGTRVRHVGDPNRGINPRPEYGEGIAQTPNGPLCHVVWPQQGRLNHYTSCLQVVEEAPAPVVNLQPLVDELRAQNTRLLEDNAVLRNDVRNEQQARRERRQLFSTYHSLYRDNRRGSGYDTREAAEEANPRARRVVEKRYYSDGSTDWNDGE